jgi:murein DD-endopeptidase MepM/ murein hydrolase activator NlpD
MNRIAGALLVAVLASACARTGPPAPVVDRRAQPVETRQTARPGTAVETVAGQYFVKPGDTVYSVAKLHGLPVRSLIEGNGLTPPYALEPGRELRLPALRLHVVERGDTLYGVSRKYNVSMASLARGNGLAEPYTIQIGQRLALPASAADTRGAPLPRERIVGTILPTPATPGSGPAGVALPAAPQGQVVAEKLDVAKPEAGTAVAPAKSDAPPTQVAASPPAPPSVPAGTGEAKGFVWPVAGQVTSRFGPKDGGLHNDGINIAAKQGTPVRAAASGTVAYAGNELKGYGNLVLVRHAGGWMTAYAHNAELLVKRGDAVKQGQAIARAGATGSVREPQLHFEIRRGSQAVDPLAHLPPRMAALLNQSNKG